MANRDNYLFALSFIAKDESGLALVSAPNATTAFQILKNEGRYNYESSQYILLQSRNMGLFTCHCPELMLESYTNATVAYEKLVAMADTFVGPPGKDGKDGADGEPGPPGSDAEVTLQNIQRALGYTPVSPFDISQFITKTVDDLTNYYLKSETYTKAEVEALIAGISGVSFVVANSLPTASASTMGKIYLIPSAHPSSPDVKDEYVTILNGGTYSWELIGSTFVDLSNYPTIAEMNAAIDAALTTIISGVNVTVDANVGTPSATVTFSGGIMSFAFHNLKGETGAQGPQGIQGPQGETGPQGPAAEIADNLTTDDPTVALSAAQGVVLEEEISQLEAKLYDFVSLDLTDIRGGFITGPPYSWYGVDANLVKHIVFPCQPGDVFILKENPTQAYNYTWLKSYDTSTTPDVCSGASLVEMTVDTEYTLTAPADAAYFYLKIKGVSLVDGTPQYVKQGRLASEVLNERMGEVEQEVEQLQEELETQLKDEVTINFTDIKNGYITGPPYNWHGTDGTLTHHFVHPCSPGDVFKIKGNSTRASIYTFLKSYSIDAAPDLCSGASLVTMELGGEVTVIAPEDAAYIYFTTKSNALIDMTPQYLKEVIPYFEEIDERLDEIEGDIEDLSDESLVLDGKILAINNKIAGVNLDITDDVVYTNGKVWNSSLELVTLSVYYNAASIDVSQYVGAALKVFTYGGNTGYQGFKLEDGTPYGVELIPGTDWNKPREFVIPPRAKTFYFSYSTSLGITQKVQFVLSSIADDTIFQAEGGTIGTFNDVKTNQRKLSLFRKMLGSEVVDKFNRLVVSFNGDSILGSQLNGITPSAEYDTGDYPPNMSRVIAARMFFDRYKFDGEDTVFRNLEHADWTKTGFNVNKGKGDSSTGGFNEFEVWGCASASDVAEITVTGYKYFKLIWSRRNVLTDAWECSVLVSVDGGAYQTPTQAGLTLANTIGTITNHEEMQVYSICELNTAKTYAFKIQPTSNYDKVKFWGCEYWNNPRLDVVVEAFSGSYARAQVLRMTDSWGSDWHTPKIIICDVLAINDNTYYNNGSITISDWMKDNTELLDRAKGRGIPILLIANHIVTATLPALASPYARQTELADIDIPTKMSVYPPESSITGPDGLHLSDYGNAYFFAELQRIFG